MNKIVGSFYQLVAFSCVSVAVVGKAKHVKLRYEKIAPGSSRYFWSFLTNDKLIFSSVTSVTQATKNCQKATNNVLVQPSSSFYDVEQTTIIPGFQKNDYDFNDMERAFRGDFNLATNCSLMKSENNSSIHIFLLF